MVNAPRAMNAHCMSCSLHPAFPSSGAHIAFPHPTSKHEIPSQQVLTTMTPAATEPVTAGAPEYRSTCLVAPMSFVGIFPHVSAPQPKSANGSTLQVDAGTATRASSSTPPRVHRLLRRPNLLICP
ncbi:hypothetical protein DL93DRAFT_2080802 [Clavulina sp. PMI_390]|nr:hypothetical protein DL93DRAFT_2080802 [Clavulina sp. PMI_390]